METAPPVTTPPPDASPRPDAASSPDVSPWQAWRVDMGRYAVKLQGLHPLRRFYYLFMEEAVWAVSIYRLSQAISRVNVPVAGPLLRLFVLPLRTATRIISGIDIAPGVRIGPGLYIGHAGMVRLHEDVVMGENCNLPHDVTMGVGGMGRRRGVPRIGQCVFISPGAKIYGAIEIGDYVVIGPNAVVTRSVPSCTVVGGVPARVVARTTPAAVKKLIFGQDYADEVTETPPPASSA